MATGARRRVLVVFGPPGAGKSTYANSLGLEVYDRDDAGWCDDERLFRAALVEVARDPDAQAVVIRTGATESARKAAIEACAATDVKVLLTPPDECIRRVRLRGRGNVLAQVAAVEQWWATYRAEMTVKDAVVSRRW